MRDESGAQYCLFDTAFGACGLAWSARGITRLQLPERDRGATEARLSGPTGELRPGEPPEDVAAVIAEIQAYLTGREVRFASVRLDLGGISRLYRQIYDATRAVGWGVTATYGELARRIGSPGAARVVGQAMGRNPVPIVVPCHRILASGNRMGGFSAHGGADTKARLLALEGVHLAGPRLPGL